MNFGYGQPRIQADEEVEREKPGDGSISKHGHKSHSLWWDRMPWSRALEGLLQANHRKGWGIIFAGFVALADRSWSPRRPRYVLDPRWGFETIHDRGVPPFQCHAPQIQGNER